jgi:DNA ligase-1
MTATEWDSATMEPTGWFMTEKFDGMRLYWNGSSLYTRNGTKVKAPESITSQLPDVALDGEIWYFVVF